MFGLLQPIHRCGQQQQSQYRQHRMHYCGTCKTIGRQYGQTARLTLNYDAVFLGELLSALAQTDLQNWSSAYQAINQCLHLPAKTEELPAALRYAAAANVFLAEIKLKDHLADGQGSFLRRGFYKWSSKHFRQAAKDLSAFGLDLPKLYALAEGQNSLEQTLPPGSELSQALAYYAAPTMQLTAAIFGQSAQALGLDPALEKDLEAFGSAFGLFAYALDAWEDFVSDAERGQFNPIIQHFEGLPPVEALAEIQALLGKWQHEAIARLEGLPLPSMQLEDFTARFLGRSTQKIYNTEFVQDLAPQPKALSLRERLAQRWQQSKEKAYAMVCPQEHKRAQLQYFLVSLAVFVAPQSTDYYQAQQVADGRAEGFRWGLFILAMLGSLGFAWLFKNYFKLPPDLRKKERKQGRISRWFSQLKRRNNCWAECLGACAVACCTVCCEASCNGNCCNVCNGNSTCCDGCCNESMCSESMCSEGECCNKNQGCLWLSITFGILLFIALFVFLFAILI